MPQTFPLFIQAGDKSVLFPAQRRMKRLSGTVQYSSFIMDLSGRQPAYFYNS